MAIDGATSSASVCPARSTRHCIVFGLPSLPLARIRSRMRAASEIATPSMPSTRSPLRRPALAPAPSGLTSPSTGSLKTPPRPIRCISLVSTSLVSRPVRSSVTGRCAWPSRPLTISCSASPRITACVTSQRRSVIERRSCHSTPSMDELALHPARPQRRPARSCQAEPRPPVGPKPP